MNVNEAFSSKYIRHSDLNGKRIAVIIARVAVETVGQGTDARKKPVLYFQGKDKGLALNKTNAFTVSKIIGSPDTDHWTGHKIVLFPDTTLFQGQMVDCVRITAMPQGQHLAAPPPPPPPAEEVVDFQASDDDVPF